MARPSVSELHCALQTLSQLVDAHPDYCGHEFHESCEDFIVQGSLKTLYGKWMDDWRMKKYELESALLCSTRIAEKIARRKHLVRKTASMKKKLLKGRAFLRSRKHEKH